MSMNNRGFTPAEMQQHTILTNRAALQPADTCPTCGSKLRQGLRGGSVYDLCSDRACSWGGAVRLPELQERVKAEMLKGVA